MNVYTKLYSEQIYNLKSVPEKNEEPKEEQTGEKSAVQQTMQLSDEKSTNMRGADLVADMNRNMIMIEKTSTKSYDRAKSNENLDEVVEGNRVFKAVVMQKRANEASGDGIPCTLEELVAENESIWTYVKGLLEQYGVNYNDNFSQIGDGSSNPDNIPIMAPLAVLRSILIATPEGNAILQELNERVRIYLQKLVYFHLYIDKDPITGEQDGEIKKNCLKHPMHFGIWVTLCGN